MTSFQQILLDCSFDVYFLWGTSLFDATSSAELTRSIARIQQELIRLAAAKNQARISDPTLLKRAKIDEERTEISRAI